MFRVFFLRSGSEFVRPVFPEPVPKTKGSDKTKDQIFKCHKPDPFYEVHIHSDHINCDPEHPAFDLFIDHEECSDNAHDCYEGVHVRKGAGLGKDFRKNFVNIFCKRSKHKGSHHAAAKNQPPVFALHKAYAQFLFVIFLIRFGMCPPPPANEIGDEKKHL